MKIISSTHKKSAGWTQKIIDDKQKKFASLSVEGGKVNCPIKNALIDTISCELCDHCSGMNFKMETSEEFVKCAHEYATMEKVASADPMENFNDFSSKSNKIDEKVQLDDFHIFPKTKKFDDLDKKDILSQTKVKSSRSADENEFKGGKSIDSENRNSIFNSSTLEEMEKIAKQEIKNKEEKIKQEKADKETRKKEWDTDAAAKIKESGYVAPKLRSIASETNANNPDVSEYKFSIFENIDDKLKNIVEKTEGEKLKTAKSNRKESISRKKDDFDWEKADHKSMKNKDIVDGYFNNLFGKK